VTFQEHIWMSALKGHLQALELVRTCLWKWRWCFKMSSIIEHVWWPMVGSHLPKNITYKLVINVNLWWLNENHFHSPWLLPKPKVFLSYFLGLFIVIKNKFIDIWFTTFA